MKVKPDAVVRAIKLAKAIGSKIDPSFGSIPMPIEEGMGVPLERARGGGLAQRVRLPLRYPKPHMADGGTPDFAVDNAMSVFPKPQRMWDEDKPGGAYLSMPDQTDITGHKAAQAAIGVHPGGKPYFHASRDEVDQTGTPGKGSALVKTNLFKQKAGWRWKDAPEGHEDTHTIVSVEHRGNHHYVLGAHFPNGVDLSRYPDAPSEPRLRPTTRGSVELGPQVGSILVRGREHPVHSHAIVREFGGRVGYDAGGAPDDDRQGNLSAFLEGNHPLVPDVVYHGTDRDISEFDTEQPRRVDAGSGSTDTGWYGKGHYFTPHKRAASHFASDYRVGEDNGPNVMPVHLSLKNPFIVKVPRSSSGAEEMDRAMTEAGFPKTSDQRLLSKGLGERRPSEQTKMLMDAGHDGVIVMHQYGIKDRDEERAAEAREQDAWEKHQAAKNAFFEMPFEDAENAHLIKPIKDEFIRTRREYHAAKEAAGGEYHPHELVVFKPHQIKSAIGNSGQYDPHEADITKAKGGRIHYALGGSDDDDAPIVPDELPSDFYAQPDSFQNFYSKAADLAHNAPMKHATADEWKNYLTNRGVRPSEFKWSDFDRKFAPLEGANRPEQITREDIARHFYRELPPIDEKIYTGDDAHYPEWTLPGGSNYRETLLHDADPDNVKHQHSHWAKEAHPRYNEDMEDEDGFGSYYGEELEDTPNVYVHARTKDRVTREGKKVLHGEEVQSDWGQEGRKGFRPENLHDHPDYTSEAEDRLDDYIQSLRDRTGRDVNGRSDAIFAADEFGEVPLVLDLYREAREEGRKKRKIRELPIEGPYVGKTQDWTDLAIKHLLTRAAKEGYDYLAWTPGSEQAKRYSLEKHIGQIHYSPVNEDTGLHNVHIINPEGELTHSRYLHPDDLASYLGKDAAQKIMRGEGDPVEGHTYTNRYGREVSKSYKPDTKALKDLDFTVGGEGMQKYYDEMFRKRLLALSRLHDPDTQVEQIQTEEKHPLHPDEVWEKASHSLPAIPISSRLREGINKRGFAAHAHGGAVEGYEDGGSVEDHPLTNPVYHGVKGPTVSSDVAHGLDMEMFDREHPGTLENPQDKTKFFWKKDNKTALMLGPHVSRDPNIAGDFRFTTGEFHNEETNKREGAFARGKVMPLNTFPDEKFFPVEQSFWPNGQPKAASYDDKAVHNTVYADILQNNPKLAHEILTEYGLDDDHIHALLKGFQTGEPFVDPLISKDFKWNNAKHYLDSTATLQPSKRLALKAVKDFRKRMRDRGFVGLSYINTDEDETKSNIDPTKTIEDKKCYIVFPQRDKETGWYPMRFKHGAAYDPANKGKPQLHLATGGFADEDYNPMMGEASSENVPSVTVSPRPGKMGGYPVREGRMFDPETGNDVEPWNYTTPQGEEQPTPPPVQHPVFNEPRMDRLHKAAHKIFKSKGFNDLTEELTGLRGIQATPIVGTWKGEMEPSFVLHHPDMTPEASEKLSHLLGFGFMQDAAVTGHHNPNPENEGIPSVYMGRDKKLSRADLDRIHKASREEGLDFSQTKDGRGVKFMHFGDEGDEFDKFAESAKRIADKAKLPYLHHVNTSGELKYAQDYLKGIFGTHEGEAGESGLQPSASRSPDLFGRIVNHLVAPYAKAVASEGYRLSPERLKDTYGLTDDEHEQVRKALLPGTQDRTVIPLMEGKEQLDMRPTGDRGKATVGDALFALQNRAAAKGQIEPGDYSPEAMKKIASDIAKEVDYHVNTADKSAIGWYDAALKKAMDAYEDVFPELKTDKDKRMLFHAILGITSQGNDVHSNSVHTARLYNYLRDDKMSLPEGVNKLKGTFGDKTRAIEQNLLKFHHLVENNGYDKMRDLFGQKKSVSEWNKILKQNENLFGPDGKPLGMQGGANQKVTGWTMFGPKIGSFINNLSGDYSTLTADLWFSRTWNRLLGHNFIHTPLAEAKQYQDFRDALLAEHAHRNPDQALAEVAPGKTSNGQVMMKNGAPAPWEHGNDVGGMSREDMDNLVNDPEKMLDMAKDLSERYRKGGFKDKSDLRRRAKNWIENRELPVAAPRGNTERDFQQNTVEQAQKILKKKYGKDITVADIQAALWFLEKDLFGKMGVASEKAAPADYADAAKNTIDLINNKKLYQVKSRAAEQIPLAKANGGAIDKAILIALRAKKRSPIAIR